MVKPEDIKVFEFSPNLTTEAARSGIVHVKKFGAMNRFAIHDLRLTSRFVVSLHPKWS